MQRSTLQQGGAHKRQGVSNELQPTKLKAFDSENQVPQWIRDVIAKHSGKLGVADMLDEIEDVMLDSSSPKDE